jgi:hypothetical protein
MSDVATCCAQYLPASHDDMILAEGIAKLCEDLGVDPSDIVMVGVEVSMGQGSGQIAMAHLSFCKCNAVTTEQALLAKSLYAGSTSRTHCSCFYSRM